MKKTFQKPYYTIEDNHGGKASVYFSPNGNHKIVFSDSNGVSFFTEEYQDVNIASVEQAANDWATGIRLISA